MLEETPGDRNLVVEKKGTAADTQAGFRTFIMPPKVSLSVQTRAGERNNLASWYF
jgi:hypothetical protein